MRRSGRPSFVAVRRHLSPQGDGLEKGKILIVLYRLADARHFPRRGKQGGSKGKDWKWSGAVVSNFKSKMTCAPHHLASQGASPQGEALKKADNFCLIVRKHDEARGSHEVAEHFCRKSFCGKNCFQEIVTNRKSAKIILRSYTKVKYGLAQTILMR